MSRKNSDHLNSRVPIILTWDVDPDRWTTLEKRRQALHMAMDLCQEFGARSTFFITADFAHEYPDELARMRALGQEVGCHGLTHDDEEEYDRMTEELQRDYIAQATQKLEAQVGGRVRTFRSPRVKISGATLQLLAEHGYLADSSVCSQRVDLVSSNLINVGWLRAPRRPYRPSRANPFKRGELPIWEIPVSALVIPFISKVLNALGLRMSKLLFRLLYAESRRTGKPIVYLTHPTEFIMTKTKNKKSRRRLFTPKVLSPSYIRTHGFLLRNLLLRMDGATLFENSRQLFAYMASFSDVEFITAGEYAARYLQEAV